MGYPSRFASYYNAGEFAYGINKTTPALLAISGPNTTSGAQALQLAFGYTQTNDGTVFSPLNTNAPINVGGNSSTETVTPSAVSASTPTGYSTTSLTATFAYLHGNGDQIRSGTAGLQEALNYASSKGGGIVIVDAGWTLLGGTQAMISAATIPANVDIQDNRTGAAGSVTFVLIPAQIEAMEATPIELLGAPGANSFYQINKAVFSTSTGTAYTGGGSIKVGYGSSLTSDALAADPAATLLTGTQPQIATEAGASIAGAGTNYLNQGLYINNGTAPFAAGTSSLTVTLYYSIITE